MLWQDMGSSRDSSVTAGDSRAHSPGKGAPCDGGHWPIIKSGDAGGRASREREEVRKETKAKGLRGSFGADRAPAPPASTAGSQAA